ncbi:MAG: hypothetical protein UX16_C0004G0015 [Parcubacteria group bacterium GW2011_GWB1_45_7]|uniref:Type II secretion system protein GspH n=2 Tax=Candidatus Colwelliibacteriota TaxID=1817904 RepID=A0A1G1ZC95_9BACT|nr:MAG: hypothetical protein UX16_C0004G0015 [Parcubacteria group bacterium GW2011_GWB1_45_7]OGY57390.1 MAG: hypothetical protein A3C03_00720 [Candidatus Colwellbacteria bacterium RIFCSPHIGHO2_02_FULL_45_17]OGY62134.1 MAG: hypothetical protein A3G58_02515 [Candidatus Colwellbacteria bacterium RIFCSPLOWO2_12_FULL_46_17]
MGISRLFQSTRGDKKRRSGSSLHGGYLSIKDSAGFTLIEVLVVMGIIGILSTILVGYTRQSSRNLLLSSTEAKLISLFSRAKFLSIETFFDQLDNPPVTKKTCAYGVYVDYEKGEIFIFQDRVTINVGGTTNECDGTNNQFIENSDDAKLQGELDFVKINSTALVINDSLDNKLVNVVFIPPDPDVIINSDEGENSADLEISLLDGSNSFTLSVNNAGQIKAER